MNVFLVNKVSWDIPQIWPDLSFDMAPRFVLFNYLAKLGETALMRAILKDLLKTVTRRNSRWIAEMQKSKRSQHQIPMKILALTILIGSTQIPSSLMWTHDWRFCKNIILMKVLDLETEVCGVGFKWSGSGSGLGCNKPSGSGSGLGLIRGWTQRLN